jgi:hypothetical protein
VVQVGFNVIGAPLQTLIINKIKLTLDYTKVKKKVKLKLTKKKIPKNKYV